VPDHGCYDLAMKTAIAKQPRLGVLICGHPPESMQPTFGRFDTQFSNLLGPEEFDYQAFAVVDNEFPGSIHDADAWVISGSKHGVYEDHAWIPPLETLIRDIYKARIPMAGICFGHQIMAQALGGKVEKFSGGWAAGTQHYELDPALELGNVTLNAWHQDQVVALPDGARSLGSSNTCQFAAISYNEHTVSIQPHPEFTNVYISGLLEKRGSSLPEAIQSYVRENADVPVDNARIGTWLRNVLKPA